MPTEPSSIVVAALHPHWEADLRLSIDGSVTHLKNGSKGKYVLGSGTLTVFWDRFLPETFVLRNSVFVHDGVAVPELDTLATVKADKTIFELSSFSLRIPDSEHLVELRVESYDKAVFRQIFVKNEYASPDLPSSS